jgi:D-aspartate ligase
LRDFPPVVVIGGRIGGLGLVRSLRPASTEIHVLETSHLAPALWSRDVHPHLTGSLHGEALVQALIALRARMSGESPVLLIASEPAVLTVSERRAALEGYRFLLPRHDVVETLSDKQRFQLLAEAHGWPVPRSVAVTDTADLAGLSGLSFPVVIKPADKRSFYGGRTRRITFARSLSDAARACSEALVSGERVIVQEFVSGSDEQIYFCLFCADTKGHLVTAFSGRKLWSYPPGIGSTGVCIGAPEAHEALIALTRRIAETIEFTGLGSVEYKWDADHGRFVIIEPTVGRIDQQEEVATLAGKNIPLAAYRNAIGLPVDVEQGCAAGQSGVVWRDSAAFFRLSTSSLGSTYDGYWRRDDPLPALVQYGVNLPSQLWRLLAAYGLTARLTDVGGLHRSSRSRSPQYQGFVE